MRSDSCRPPGLCNNNKPTEHLKDNYCQKFGWHENAYYIIGLIFLQEAMMVIPSTVCICVRAAQKIFTTILFTLFTLSPLFTLFTLSTLLPLSLQPANNICC
jgi:hypothetical protein